MDLTVSVSNNQQNLVGFTDYLSTVNQDDAIDSLKNLAQMESEDWFRIGMILSSYRKSKGDSEFSNLLEYAEKNLQINGRKAYYLIDIHDCLVSSNITPSQVSDVGWTKLKEIAHLLTPENVDYWVDLCKTNTTKQLIALLKSNITVNPVKSASIDDVLAETPKIESKVVEEVTPVEEVVIHTVAETPQQEIEEKVITPKPSQGTLEAIPVEQHDDIPVSYNYTPKPVDGVEEVLPEEVESEEAMVVAVEEASEPKGLNVKEVAVKLKSYDPVDVITMVTEIYPHIKITVSEKNNAAIID